MSKKPKPPISLYAALADATRYRILEILREGPKPVHVLTEGFSISRPAISRHLRVLKTAGLVAEVKKGRENLYAFRPVKLDAARSFIDALAVRPVKPEPAGEPKPAKKSAPRPAAKKPAEHMPQDITATQTPPAVSQMGFDF